MPARRAPVKSDEEGEVELTLDDLNASVQANTKALKALKDLVTERFNELQSQIETTRNTASTPAAKPKASSVGVTKSVSPRAVFIKLVSGTMENDTFPIYNMLCEGATKDVWASTFGITSNDLPFRFDAQYKTHDWMKNGNDTFGTSPAFKTLWDKGERIKAVAGAAGEIYNSWFNTDMRKILKEAFESRDTQKLSSSGSSSKPKPKASKPRASAKPAATSKVNLVDSDVDDDENAEDA